MSDINSKLIKYKNINLIKYLNETLPTYEKSVIETEKDDIEKTKKDIETEIFKSFISNSNSLLEILYTYENVFQTLNDLKDISTDLKKINFSINFKEKPKVINKKKLQEFKSLVSKFTTDITSFDTEERYLEYFDIFKINNDRYILLLTNDILIIGKVIEDTRTYQLVNAFNYGVIDIKKNENDLYIKISQTEMIFHGKEKNITKFYEMYKQVSYTYEDLEPTEETHQIIDETSFNFYIIYTEKYDFINQIDINKIEGIDFYEKNKLLKFIYNLNNRGLVKEINLFTVDFLKNKLKDNLKNINKFKTLLELIDDVFRFYHKFYKEQNDLLREINKIVLLDNIKQLLLFESQILDCFKYFERRIFSKRFYGKSLQEIIEIIKKKCKFEGMDFSYLTDYFKDKINEQKKYYLDKAKLEIKKMIESSIN